MHSNSRFIGLTVVSVLLLAGCAVSPEAKERRLAMEADIDEILNYKLDPEEFGEPVRCLSDNDYRNFRPLGDRHMLFEGRGDKQWVNTLRGRCHDLQHGEILVVKSFSPRRICDGDRFDLTDWFDIPASRRAALQRGSTATVGSCGMGSFKPVAKAQVEEIEARLESR